MRKRIVFKTDGTILKPATQSNIGDVIKIIEVAERSVSLIMQVFAFFFRKAKNVPLYIRSEDKFFGYCTHAQDTNEYIAGYKTASKGITDCGTWIVKVQGNNLQDAKQKLINELKRLELIE